MDKKPPLTEEGLEEVTADVLRALHSLGSACDEDLAKLLGIGKSLVRKVFYRLYDARLATYKLHKDRKTRWIKFVWELMPAGIDKARAQTTSRSTSQSVAAR